eukprot:scaffold92096_cov34-Tisochrysis_lutea.AAC.1
MSTCSHGPGRTREEGVVAKGPKMRWFCHESLVREPGLAPIAHHHSTRPPAAKLRGQIQSFSLQSILLPPHC